MSIQNEINRIKKNVNDTLDVIRATGVQAGTGSDALPAAAEALASEKQDKLKGTAGQVVGFDAEGNAIPQAAPSGLPEGGTIGQLLGKTEDGEAWVDRPIMIVVINRSGSKFALKYPDHGKDIIQAIRNGYVVFAYVDDVIPFYAQFFCIESIESNGCPIFYAAFPSDNEIEHKYVGVFADDVVQVVSLFTPFSETLRDLYTDIDEKKLDAPPGGGTMQMGESLGAGPYTIELTEEGEGGDLSAEQVGYSNTGSGLEATNVQEAIDELAEKGGGEYLPLAGGTMKSNAIIQGTDNLAIVSPKNIQIGTDSAAFGIVGDTISFGGGGTKASCNAALNMNGHQIKEVCPPADLMDAANKQYVDEQAGKTGAVKGTYPIAVGQTIQAGDVVDVVEGQVQKNATPVENVETVVYQSNVTDIEVLKLSDDKIIVCSNPSSSCSLYALANGVVGPKLGGTNFYNTSSSNISLARLSDTQFVVGTVISNALYANRGVISDTTINFRGQFIVSDNTSDGVFVPLTSSSFLAIYNKSSGLNTRIVTVSDTGNRMSVEYPLSSIASASHISATQLPDSGDNKRVCVCFSDGNDGNKGKAVIATIDSANQVTWGEVVTVNTEGVSTATRISCCTYNDDVIVVSSNRTISGAIANHLNISGNVISAVGAGQNIGLGNGNAILCNIGGVLVALTEYNGTTRGSAEVLTLNGDTIVAGSEFEFNSSIARHISASVISSAQCIVAYADGGNSDYGTTTILTVMGDQIAGSFIDESQDAIALQSGTEGQDIEVIYSGTVAADWVTEGQVISSPGVYGAGVLAGVLQVWSKDRPGQIVTGSYVGTGTYGQSNPTVINYEYPPKLIVIQGIDTASKNVTPTATFLYGVPMASTYTNFISSSASGSQITVGGVEVIWGPDRVSFYNTQSDVGQFNASNHIYHYRIIF